MSRQEKPSISERVTFLLVDDLEENLTALEALLARDELELLKARSGREALELLLTHEVALAFVDVQMPEMDGFELAELMRGSERTRHVPIIFVTAGIQDRGRIFQGYEAGAVDFLHKPLEPHVLRNKADTFFQLHRTRLLLDAQLRELRANAEERERLFHEMTEALKLAEMFTAVLGHDLRNPLSVMVTGSEVIAMETEEEAVRGIAQRMLSCGRRMARMIDELLDLARARRAGGFALSPRPVDLLALSQKLVAEHRSVHPDRHVEVGHHGDTRGVWDEDRVIQAISNLLGNATRHGAANTPILLDVDGSRTDTVRLSIQNGGVIPSDVLPHLFNPFRTAADYRKRSEGLGLGLYIVQQIAKAHRGDVTVESEETTGTKFTLELPRNPPAASAPVVNP